MTPYWTSHDGRHVLYHGDCLAVMPHLPAHYFHAVLSDPPYGLNFMGKAWDHGVPGVPFWLAALRVAKPGAYLLAFGGTRTYHRLACAIEDAGWEYRDMLGWLYGSGFPKSLDASKAINKAAGAEREVVGHDPARFRRDSDTNNTYAAHCGQSGNITAPATPAARQWDGWGTALKPAIEPIALARAPMPGTVAANLLEHGTGALNINGCRIGAGARFNGAARAGKETFNCSPKSGIAYTGQEVQGRWPANIMHDGSPEVLAVFPDDNARFFYCGKATQEDRDEGLQGELTSAAEMVNRIAGSAGMNSPRAGAGRTAGRHNNHPTVKPTDLMRYLARLILPPGGICLDPFCGSGSTGKAVIREGGRFVGIEKYESSCEIAARRMEAELAQPMLIPPAAPEHDQPPLFAP